MTEVDKMNLLLSQLYTKPVGYSHHLDELSKATGLDLITIEVLGKKINDKGDCHYHHQGTSITAQGVYTVNNGGYKDDFLIPFMQYVDKSIAIHGDGNIFAPDNSGEIKGSKIQKNVDDKESKELNKKNLILSRRNIYVALIAIAVTILIALWQQGCIG